MAVITVRGLVRSFEVTECDGGLSGALRSVLRRRHRTITAVDEVSLQVGPGTVLGLLGPNGSGKTTTLKCVAGLLTPTSGTVDVLGFTPSRRETAFLRRLGFVMGQRWQLHPDLPVAESFVLHRVIYDLDRREFDRTRAELVELLGVAELGSQPARQLSLGQRMRCEFVAALLHRPPVLLLDEPTLGLDFDAQRVIREFVRRYVHETGAAAILTSHYLADIEALADQVATISRGRLTFTGSLRELQALAGDRKHLTAQLDRPLDRAVLEAIGRVVAHTTATVTIEVPRARAGAALAALESRDDVADVSLADPPLEDTLTVLYADAPAGSLAPAAADIGGASGAASR